MAIVAGAAIAAVGTIGASSMSSSASKSAAQTQSNAAQAASAQQIAAQKPWTDAGSGAVARLSAGLDTGGQYTKQFTMADATNSAAETEALNKGSQAIQNSAAAKGGLIGTQAESDLTTNAEGIAASYENQAFNQWQTQQNNSLAANQSLAGLGQTSTSQVADNVSNLTLAGANATAAGQVGSAQAINSGVGGVGNQISMLSGLFGTGTTAGGYNGNQVNAGGGYSSNPGNDGVGVDPYSNIGGASTAGDYSDERLKEDAVQVGMTNDGLPIYTYKMKSGGPRKMGVMAQDMERVKPSAVTSDRLGFKMVDYGRVS